MMAPITAHADVPSAARIAPWISEHSGRQRQPATSPRAPTVMTPLGFAVTHEEQFVRERRYGRGSAVGLVELRCEVRAVGKRHGHRSRLGDHEVEVVPGDIAIGHRRIAE